MADKILSASKDEKSSTERSRLSIRHSPHYSPRTMPVAQRERSTSSVKGTRSFRRGTTSSSLRKPMSWGSFCHPKVGYAMRMTKERLDGRNPLRRKSLVRKIWGWKKRNRREQAPPKRNLRYIRYQLVVWQTNPQFRVQLTFGTGVAWSSCLSSRLPRVSRCHRYNPAVTRTSCALAKYGASDLCPELTNSIGSPLSPGQTYCHQVPKHLCHAAVATLVRSRNCHYASRGVGRIALRD
ncbi:hypothetical protein PIB30_056417 [Stylosanthes scabra]|uniref:Uncharacterized protein n=1 Tax=Stylosanthes scabra TaxID=79078 RepID=A0ABU6ZI34_9FABA|nr:hypothetical protein [Stylosanthes scabra]